MDFLSLLQNAGLWSELFGSNYSGCTYHAFLCKQVLTVVKYVLQMEYLYLDN